MSNIIPITDFKAPELDIYARLKEAQLFHYFEPNGGIFLAESPKVIERAKKTGCTPISMLLAPEHIDGEAAGILKQCGDIPVYTAPMEILTKITGFALTRGAICAMRRPKLPTVESLCKDAHRIAILENVVNPTNVGAIFRSAAAMHMDAVLLTPGCSDPLYRRSLRVSMGCVFQIPWTYFGGTSGKEQDSLWPEKGLELLKNFGFKTAALALTDNSVSITNKALHAEDKLAVILGTEGDGLAASTIASCDYTVKIPMSHNVDSLNVAAASAVAFWELRKCPPEDRP